MYLIRKSTDLRILLLLIVFSFTWCSIYGRPFSKKSFKKSGNPEIRKKCKMFTDKKLRRACRNIAMNPIFKLPEEVKDGNLLKTESVTEFYHKTTTTTTARTTTTTTTTQQPLENSILKDYYDYYYDNNRVDNLIPDIGGLGSSVGVITEPPYDREGHIGAEAYYYETVVETIQPEVVGLQKFIPEAPSRSTSRSAEGRSSCRNLPSGKGSPQMSISPWDFYIDNDPLRIPQKLLFARCLCQGCIDKFTGTEDTSVASEPLTVKADVIMRKSALVPYSSCNSEKHNCEEKVIDVPIGCHCRRYSF